MPDADVWKTEEMSKVFLNDVRSAIPLAAEQLEILLRLVALAQPALANFLDLGCGDGLLGRTIMQRFPQATGVFVDFSTPMLNAARAKVPNAPAHRFVQADLSNRAWRETIAPEVAFDTVVSGFAIHHLPDPRKRELYGEIHSLLKPGGLFLNLEHVASPTPWLAQAHDGVFVDALLAYKIRRGETKSRAEVAAAHRNRMDNSGNILTLVETQCAWLRQLGFEHVDCYFKIFELALFGGVKALA